MALPSRARKVVLTAHVSTAVGWLGAVAAYIALDITATVSEDVQTVRAAYLAMEISAFYAIVPLAVASVLIGIVNALGTSWGLFQHYWVLVKLLLTLLATTILLVETQTISVLAEAAAGGVDPRELPGSLVHSVGGLVVLLVITAMSVYKPRGMTRYGWRKQQQPRPARREQHTAPVP